jgi:hypothetical protein
MSDTNDPTSRKTEHKQVFIQGYGQKANVDEGIATLIRELWCCGIWTLMSCQEGAHGYVWLCFPHAGEAADFLQIVAEYDPEPDSLYQRALGLVGVPGIWKVGTFLDDYSLVEELDGPDGAVEESHTGRPDFCFEISIWFPPSDLPAVLKRLAAQPTVDWEGTEPASYPAGCCDSSALTTACDHRVALTA